MEFIDLKAQYTHIKDDIQRQINQVLDAGQYIMGPQVKEFECDLAKYIGVKHAIGVSDGTIAIILALMALDIKPGDEVIVPAFTFFATASQVALLGAIPVFADVDLESYTLCPKSMEALITSKTRAVIPVNLYGQCANMTVINQIAAKHNLVVIEDAAQSMGASHHGVKSGNLATISTTSFFPSKPLGCYGDGGACFTNDEQLAKKLRMLRVHGQEARYHHVLLGTNARLDTLQAAILQAKLCVFEGELEARHRIGERYNELLSGIGCTTPKTVSGNTHVYAQYTVLVENRKEFIQKLKAEDIPTAIHYPIPLHKQPSLVQYYRGQSLANSERLAEVVVSLPMHPYLDNATQDHIARVVLDSLPPR